MELKETHTSPLVYSLCITPHFKQVTRKMLYFKKKLHHDTVNSSLHFLMFCIRANVTFSLFCSRGLSLLYWICIMESQAALHHCLFGEFLERWCSVALFYERHNKLFCQFLDEQPLRVCPSPHLIRLQCFECSKWIWYGNIKHFMPKNY